MSVGPILSVIVPAYNSGWSIQRCLFSILHQDVDFEVETIVIDDCSTDDTAALASACAGNVRVLQLPANLGPGAARNHGINAAQGTFIAFLDSDDTMLPGRLKDQVGYLENNPVVVMVFGGATFDNAPHDLYMSTVPAHDSWTRLADPYRHLWTSDGECALVSTVMIRKLALVEAGNFDTRFRCGEDFDLWLRLALTGPFAYRAGPFAQINASRHYNKLTRSEYVYLDGPMALFRALQRDSTLKPDDRAIARRRCRKSVSMMLRYQWTERQLNVKQTPLSIFRDEFGNSFVLKWVLIRFLPSPLGRLLREIRQRLKKTCRSHVS